MKILLILLVTAWTLFQAEGKNLTNEIDSWIPPPEMAKKFPYYLSGFDKEQRPIWVFETGKYPFKWMVHQGKEFQKDFEKYYHQMLLRVRASKTMRNPNGKELCILSDFDGMKFTNYADFKTMKYMRKLSHMYESEDDQEEHDGYTVIVNVDPVTETFINLFRTEFPDMFEKLHIYSRRKGLWMKEILKHFPRDQIPEWYGGNKGFKPLQVYG